jgi:hypothetical protein
MKLAPKLTFFTLFLIGVNFFFATVAASQTPSIQASNIVISNITSTSATISWTNGNGTNRAVFIENPSGTAAAPYDNISYSASSDWNNKGDNIGTSNYYCVYNGTGNSVTVTNLPPEGDFAVRISEYNGLEGSEQYLTTIVSDNPKTFSTSATSLPPPTTQASDIVISNITSNSATISWTNGNGSKRVVFVESPSGIAAAPYNNTTYSASSDWNNKGTKIGSSNYYCVYNGSGNSVTLTNLPPDNNFTVRISEYNGSDASEAYLTQIVSGNPTTFMTLESSTLAPTVQASNIVVNNITSTAAAISWTNGNGSNRVVFVENPSGTAAAPYHNNTYSASSDWSNKGTKIGSSNYYCVYNGNGNSVNVTNLPPSSNFAIRISEYNGSAGNELYLTTLSTGNPENFSTLDATTAIIENEANNSAKIRISPNPTSDVIIVTCNQDIKESVAITISDINGKLIHNCISHTKTTEFDLTNNPPGFYIVKVEVDGTTSVTKVIKI